MQSAKNYQYENARADTAMLCVSPFYRSTDPFNLQKKRKTPSASIFANNVFSPPHQNSWPRKASSLAAANNYRKEISSHVPSQRVVDIREADSSPNNKRGRTESFLDWLVQKDAQMKEKQRRILQHNPMLSTISNTIPAGRPTLEEIEKAIEENKKKNKALELLRNVQSLSENTTSVPAVEPPVATAIPSQTIHKVVSLKTVVVPWTYPSHESTTTSSSSNHHFKTHHKESPNSSPMSSPVSPPIPSSDEESTESKESIETAENEAAAFLSDLASGRRSSSGQTSTTPPRSPIQPTITTNNPSASELPSPFNPTFPLVQRQQALEGISSNYHHSSSHITTAASSYYRAPNMYSYDLGNKLFNHGMRPANRPMRNFFNQILQTDNKPIPNNNNNNITNHTKTKRTINGEIQQKRAKTLPESKPVTFVTLQQHPSKSDTVINSKDEPLGNLINHYNQFAAPQARTLPMPHVNDLLNSSNTVDKSANIVPTQTQVRLPGIDALCLPSPSKSYHNVQF